MTVYIQQGFANNKLNVRELKNDLLTALVKAVDIVPKDTDITSYKKKNALYFISGEITPNKDGQYIRNNNNMKYRDYAVLDIEDTGKSNSELVAIFNDKLAKYSYAYYPSISHTEDNPRYRVVVELDRNANGNEYSNVITELYKLLGVNGDTSAKTFSQLQGLPICKELEKDNYKVVVNRGIKYSVKEVIQEKKEIAKSSPVNLGQISDSEAIEIFTKYINNEVDRLQNRDDKYLSVIATLGKSVLAEQISYEVAIECCELLAQDNQEWKENNVKHLNNELKLANGNIAYFSTKQDFISKFKNTQNYKKATNQMTGKPIKIYTDENGKPLKTLPNYEKMILSQYSIAINQLNHSIEIRSSNGEISELDTRMIEVIRMEMAKKYNIKISKDDLKTAIISISNRYKYHPIKNIIEAKQWDGVQRAETFFIDMLGAEDTFYIREITRKFLLAAVYRIYQPGYKFDEILILKGGQGIGKSTAIEKLSMGYTVKIQDEITKETELKTQEAWIVELEELDALRKTKSNKMKGWISASFDHIRPPYEIKYKKVPRQHVIAGTTNEKEFLKDKTGNRRYWITKCADKMANKPIFEIDDEYILQLWAEVFLWYKSGENLLISQETSTIMQELAKETLLMDEIEHDLIDLLELEMPKGWYLEKQYEVQSYVQALLNGRESIHYNDYPKEQIQDITTKEIIFFLTKDNDNVNYQNTLNSRKLKKLMDNMEGWRASEHIIRNGKRYRGYKRKNNNF